MKLSLGRESECTHSLSLPPSSLPASLPACLPASSLLPPLSDKGYSYNSDMQYVLALRGTVEGADGCGDKRAGGWARLNRSSAPRRCARCGPSVLTSTQTDHLCLTRTCLLHVNFATTQKLGRFYVHKKREAQSEDRVRFRGAGVNLWFMNNFEGK
jgi:hypothetical protein